MSHFGSDQSTAVQIEASPGPVADWEPIVLAAIEPRTFRDGSLHKLNHEELKKCSLSVCRAAYITGSNARETIVAPMLARDPAKIDRGFVWAESGEVRAITLASLGVGAFCVIDHPLDGFAAHAHLGYTAVIDKKNDRQVARGDLQLLFLKRGYFSVWSGHPFLLEEAEKQEKAKLGEPEDDLAGRSILSDVNDRPQRVNFPVGEDLLLRFDPLLNAAKRTFWKFVGFFRSPTP